MTFVRTNFPRGENPVEASGRKKRKKSCGATGIKMLMWP